jgi:hypothetical protein
MTKDRLRPLAVCAIGVALGAIAAGKLIDWDVQGRAKEIYGGALVGLCLSLVVIAKASSALSALQKGVVGGIVGFIIGGMLGTFSQYGKHRILETVLFALLFGMCGFWWARNVYLPGLDKRRNPRASCDRGCAAADFMPRRSCEIPTRASFSFADPRPWHLGGATEQIS